jgi:hypothetical protein
MPAALRRRWKMTPTQVEEIPLPVRAAGKRKGVVEWSWRWTCWR